jgi:signal transduction histidine kinase
MWQVWLAFASAVAFGVAAFWLAVRLRTARARERELIARLASDRAAERELAAAQERARIAREMHDVVAHTLSVVVAQADGGRFAAQTDPDASARTLATIAEVSRAALAEMRALLGVLRDADGDATLGPQPSLEDIPALVSQAREAGLEVSMVATGTPCTLPIGAGLAVHRIVQEGLTNVRQHAGPKARAFVQLAWEADALVATVSDDGRGAAAADDGNGQGLLGMHERAAMFGGTLTAGPKAGGGYVVRARVPIARASKAAA